MVDRDERRWNEVDNDGMKWKVRDWMEWSVTDKVDGGVENKLCI